MLIVICQHGPIPRVPPFESTPHAYRNAADMCIYDYANVYQCRKCYKTPNIAPWTSLSVIIGYTLSKSPIIEDNQAPEGRRKKLGPI